MRKILTLFATLAACGLIGYGMWTLESPQAADEEEEHHDHHFVAFDESQLKAHAIDVELAGPGVLKQLVRAPARVTISADQVAHIIPKSPGIAQGAYKNLGEKVAKDEILATLESREMAEAKAAYLTAIKKEQLTNKSYLREKDLHSKKISAAQDFYEAEHNWEAALIDLELTRQKLHALGLTNADIDQLSNADPKSLRTYELRSPMDGIVISRHITLGELINTDQEVYVIADLAKVWAEISIFAKDRPYINENQNLTISTSDGKTTQAKVVYLSWIIDQETRTSKAIAEIDNASQLWLPGTFAQAELVTDEIPVPLIITKEAVQNIDGVNAIFVAANDGFDVRPITTGRMDENHFEVLSGLAPGEKYASKNTFMLKAELQKDEAEHMD